MQYHFPFENQIEKYLGDMILYTQEIDQTQSIAWIDIDGTHGEIKNIGADRTYLIIKWQGLFVIEGKEIPVDEKDIVYIPKGTTYNITWTFSYVLVNMPAFTNEQDIWTNQ